MEKIRINAINKKPSGLVIVKYNKTDMLQTPELEATLNTKWQSKQVDYLEKDVGIGGTVDVTIQQKGEYTNIVAVDFKSAEKGEMTILEKNVAGIPVKPTQEKFRTPNEMVATELTVAMIRQTEDKVMIRQTEDNVIITADVAVQTYKETLRLLDE